MWDEDEAQRALAVFPLLQHPKGSHFGKAFDLELWQEELVIAPLFGWKREDGRRRFRRGYISMSRKNGKTALAAGIAHKLATFDNEPGAEVYCFAKSRDQAKILFEDFVKGMISSDLADYYELFQHHILSKPTKGKIKALASEAGSAHGFNPHGAIGDELHTHKNRDMWDAMLSGQANRRNPLLLGITTRGSDRASICWELDQEAIAVLDPSNPVEDDSLFAYISTIDGDDDPFDPNSWEKANPNLGITVDTDFLANLAQSASRNPGLENSFRRYNLNQWTEQETRWIPMQSWDKAGNNDLRPSDFKGLPCWAGLDIGDTRDISALTLVFRKENDFFGFAWFWAPKESIDERADRDRREVKVWMDRGLITGLPGARTSSELLAEGIAEVFNEFSPLEIAFDRWGANATIERLQQDHGIPESMFIDFRQSAGNFSPVMKEFDSLLNSGRFHHSGDPVLRWNASNLAVKENAQGYIQPSKDASGDKIDGIVSMFMSLGLAIAQEGQVQDLYYESNEVEIF